MCFNLDNHLLHSKLFFFYIGLLFSMFTDDRDKYHVHCVCLGLSWYEMGYNVMWQTSVMCQLEESKCKLTHM